MRRIIGSMTVLAALIAWSASETANAQSMAKALAGPPVTIEGMKSASSPKWKMEKSTGATANTYNFKWPKAKLDKEDAEMTIAPSKLEKDEEIIEAWTKMFEAPKDKDLKDLTKQQKVKVGKADVTFLDIKATYVKGTTKIEGQRFLGVIFDLNGKKVLIQVLGGNRTVVPELGDFKSFVGSFK